MFGLVYVECTSACPYVAPEKREAGEEHSGSCTILSTTSDFEGCVKQLEDAVGMLKLAHHGRKIKEVEYCYEYRFEDRGGAVKAFLMIEPAVELGEMRLTFTEWREKWMKNDDSEVVRFDKTHTWCDFDWL